MAPTSVHLACRELAASEISRLDFSLGGVPAVTLTTVRTHTHAFAHPAPRASSSLTSTMRTAPPGGASAAVAAALAASVIGANVAFDGGNTAVSGLLAFVALTLAMINVVGGFAVTNRMLSMIAGKKRGGA